MHQTLFLKKVKKKNFRREFFKKFIKLQLHFLKTNLTNL